MEEKEQVRKLWDLCFDDDEAFKDFYFERRFKDRESYVIHHEGVLASSLQLLPYTMNGWNNLISVGYVSGACTHPEYRRLGLMHNLMCKTMQTMYQKLIPLMALIPASDDLYQYYQKFGFTTVFYSDRSLIALKSLHRKSDIKVSKVEKADAKICTWLSDAFDMRPFAINHNETDDIEDIFTDIYLSKGCVFQASDTLGKCLAVLFAYPHEKTLIVKDCVMGDNEENQEIRETLYSVACETLGCNEVKDNNVLSEKREDKVGMARAVHVLWLLKHYAKKYKDAEFTISLTDSMITKNTGCYSISEGTCTKSDYMPSPDYHFDIAQLTDFLFKNEGLSMTLMLD